MKTLKISDLHFSYGTLKVIDGITAEIPRSAVTAVLGPSGCGKTTLLNLLAGLLQADSGTLEGFKGEQFSYCFQEPRLLPWSTALDNILYALSSTGDPIINRQRAIHFMDKAGLKGYEHVKPEKLSGGMNKRVSLARAFSYESDILLLDESFTSVDLKQRLELMNVFSLLQTEERRTSILVTHEIKDALYLADQIILLSKRPSTVLETISVTIPGSERRYGDPRLKDIEAMFLARILS